ncbi:MAG: amidohydrolase family protein [Candidatus Bathyarchaeia archaeon]
MSLEEFIENLRIIDSHEHLASEDTRLEFGADPFQTFIRSYASSDLKSAGLSLEDYVKVLDDKRDILERWKIVEPYWNKTSNTGYFSSIKIVASDLYGIDEINERTIKPLADKMKLANKKGLYRWVLKDKAKIDKSIVDNDFWDSKGAYHYTVDVDYEFFTPVVRLENFIFIRSREDIWRISEMQGAPIHSLQELETALRLTVERMHEKIVGFKIVLAYYRNLFFEKVTFGDAEKVLNKILSSSNTFSHSRDMTFGPARTDDQLSIAECKNLQDYMIHRILQLASKYSLPVQIHTGLQEGNQNLISNSNPILLANLFMEYRDVVFDVFHGAYPYTKELTTLVKNFPNVNLDMCWLHIISPAAAREALADWLDAVPASKIIGFGGDQDWTFVEGAYSNAKIARNNISRVLRSKVDEGTFSEKEAIRLAQMLFRDNVLHLYGNLGR